MKLIVALGNPGKQYQNTRHNIGFAAIDEIIKFFNWETPKLEKKFKAEISLNKIDGLTIILIKPQTFMNNSGESVQAVMDFYKIKTEDLIIIHDDKDLPLGEFKIQTNRGDAGHNGIKSIIEKLGTKDFTRIRIGVASDNEKKMENIAKFVLSKFGIWEKGKVKKVMGEVIKEIKKIIT
jgi:PTH1 family peptidyl-tRNA hydrolase